MCLIVCLYLCMSVCLYMCLYVCMSVCLYISISVCLYVCMSVCLYVCISVFLYVCVSVYVSVCLYVCISVFLYVCYVCMSNKFLVLYSSELEPCTTYCKDSVKVSNTPPLPLLSLQYPPPSFTPPITHPQTKSSLFMGGGLKQLKFKTKKCCLLYTYLLCLSVCLFVTDKRQNG